MQFKRVLLFPLLLVRISIASAAEFYITDNISVGVFDTSEMQGAPELHLTSGTPVDVIESRGDLRKIKTEHGDQGWIKANYLVKGIPLAQKLEEAKQNLAQQDSALEALQQENDALKKLSADAKSAALLRGDLEKLRTENEALKARLAGQPRPGGSAALLSIDDQVSALQAQLEEVKGEKGELEQRLAAAVLIGGGAGLKGASLKDIQVALPAVIVIVIISLLLGGWLGYLWLDKRLLKRFGGIRFH